MIIFSNTHTFFPDVCEIFLLIHFISFAHIFLISIFHEAQAYFSPWLFCTHRTVTSASVDLL